MDGVINKSRRVSISKHASSMDHQRIQKSSTLNRRFVKKPTVKPIITNTTASVSRGVQRQTYNRTILQKGKSVKLQPLSQAKKVDDVAVTPKKTSSPKASASVVKKKAVNDIAPASSDGVARRAVSAAATAQQRQQAQRRAAAAQKIVKRRTGDIYVKNPQATAAKQRIAARKQAAARPKQLTAQQMKDRAIQQALSRMNTVNQADRFNGKTLQAQFAGVGAREPKQSLFGRKKFALAISMAVVSVALLGYLVYLNMPDLSARVAATQAGIEKSYPGYVPANYRLDGLVRESNGRITMNFKNDRDQKFTLQEEKSSWDSAAVLANYVKKNWKNDYSIAKGQGLTIYISGSNATWVNGGVLYIITDKDGNLKSSDLHDIAVSF